MIQLLPQADPAVTMHHYYTQEDIDRVGKYGINRIHVYVWKQRDYGYIQRIPSLEQSEILRFQLLTRVIQFVDHYWFFNIPRNYFLIISLVNILIILPYIHPHIHTLLQLYTHSFGTLY